MLQSNRGNYKSTIKTAGWPQIRGKENGVIWHKKLIPNRITCHCPEAWGSDANPLVQLCLSDVLWRVPKRRERIRSEQKVEGQKIEALSPCQTNTDRWQGSSSHLVIVHDSPNSADLEKMKGKMEAVITTPRHLLMDWKSCSGLDIVGDNLDAMSNLPLSAEQSAMRNWSKLEISERSPNLQAC